jgi:hypothetical protein
MVTVLAIAPLLAIFHQASVRHAVCEHGDVIETGAVHEAAAPTPHEGAALDSFQADSEPAAHGHAHCSVGTLAKSGTGVIPPAAVAGALSEAVELDLVHVEVVRPRPVLPSAPKTSPPLVRALS